MPGQTSSSVAIDAEPDAVLAVVPATALPTIRLLRRKAERTIVDGALRGLERRVEA